MSRIPPLSRALVAAALLGALALFIALGAAQANHHEEAGQPTLVKIHADWCGTCVKLNPTWAELEAQWGGAVQFVVLDVTSEETRAAAKEQAARLGLAEVYADHGKKSGTVAIIDGKTLRVLRVLVGETDASRYRGILEYALGS